MLASKIRARVLTDDGDVVPHPVDQHVGRRVRQQRIAKGKSQTDLANALGLTFQQVQKYERGANRISASKLWDTAQTLEVDISVFFEGFTGVRASKDDTPMPAAKAPITRITVEIEHLAGQLPVGKQRLVRDLLREMAAQSERSTNKLEHPAVRLNESRS